MIELKYSLIVEATDDPSFFGFYSEDLEGFTGIGHSIEDCIYKAKWGMEEHLALLRAHRLPIPQPTSSPTITIQNQPPRRRLRRKSTPRRLNRAGAAQ